MAEENLPIVDDLDLHGVGQIWRIMVQQPPNPPHLYHYTSSEGFRGIIEHNCLWYSDALLLNDGSEVYYGNNMLSEEMAKFMEGRSEAEHQLMQEVHRRTVTEATNDRPVVFCLCELPNLLNQWRDYGRDIVPYCIEFQTDLLPTSDWSFPTGLIKLIYDEGKQRKLLAELIKKLFGIVKKLKFQKLDGDRREKLIAGMVQELRLLLLHYKHHAFEAEREWRCVSFSHALAGQEIGWRSNSLGVVPYFVRTPRKGTLLPISKVWVGPSPYGAVSKNALDGFLANKGYQIDTEASVIPAR